MGYVLWLLLDEFEVVKMIIIREERPKKKRSQTDVYLCRGRDIPTTYEVTCTVTGAVYLCKESALHKLQAELATKADKHQQSMTEFVDEQNRSFISKLIIKIASKVKSKFQMWRK